MHHKKHSSLPPKGWVKEDKTKTKFFGKLFSPYLHPSNILSNINVMEAWRFFIDANLQSGEPELIKLLKKIDKEDRDLTIQELYDTEDYPELKSILNTFKLSSEEAKSLTLAEFSKQYRGWLGFERREEGYLFGICRATGLALSHKGKLNSKFIKTLHKTAISVTKDTEYDALKDIKKEGFRDLPEVNYTLTAEMVTEAGLRELFQEISESTYLYLLITAPSSHTIISAEMLQTKSTEQKEFYLKKALDYIQHSKKNPSHQKEVKLFSVIKPEKNQTISQQIEKYHDQLVNEYYQNIKNAHQDEDKKLAAILTYIKKAEHLHPFIDGNGRIFFMATLMYLFNQNYLPQSLLNNMNIIGGYSIDELITEVRLGTKNLIQLGRGEKIFGVLTKDILKNDLSPTQLIYFESAIAPLTKYFKIETENKKTLENNSEKKVTPYSRTKGPSS